MARYAKQKTPQAVRNPFEPMLKTVEPDFRTGNLGLLQPCQDPGKVCKWWVLIWRSAREKSKTSETAKEF